MIVINRQERKQAEVTETIKLQLKQYKEPSLLSILN